MASSETLTPQQSVIPPGFAAEEPGLLAPIYPLPRLELVSGHGARVRDALGREYLDFVSGIAVNAFGHTPEGLAETISTQLGTLGHISNLYANRPAIELAKLLTRHTGYSHAFFCNSGTEGIDSAIKFARAHAFQLGRPGRDIVAFQGGFHGRTGFALSATYTPSYREPFLPLIPGVRFAPYNDVAALETVLDTEVCAVVLELVQGESGGVPATSEFLQALLARSAQVGATLTFDEVQTGMGRTGHLLAQQHHGVLGDITVMSKALGAGLPIAAVLLTPALAATLAPGMHGCTFGGNPVSAAAGVWALERVLAQGFLEQVRCSAERLTIGLEALTKKHAAVRETRGLGLLRAIDLAPDAGFDAPALVAAARGQGLLLIRGGERALRLLPPLNVTDAEIDEALAKLDAALTQLTSAKGGSQ
ncbi:MAG: aspartate aminotransferase family protein [Candidatus Eisenbacteria bacterium]